MPIDTYAEAEVDGLPKNLQSTVLAARIFFITQLIALLVFASVVGRGHAIFDVFHLFTLCTIVASIFGTLLFLGGDATKCFRFWMNRRLRRDSDGDFEHFSSDNSTVSCIRPCAIVSAVALAANIIAVLLDAGDGLSPTQVTSWAVLATLQLLSTVTTFMLSMRANKTLGGSRLGGSGGGSGRSRLLDGA